jgi:predicted RNA-binding Zn-ribbon protein involved in translation (DUF1610 family)
LGKKIKETKFTCKACGNEWFVGKQDALKNTGDALSNAGKSMMCCTGCVPALLIPTKKTTDFSKCPKCNSTAVKKEVVEHDVD